MDGSRLEIPREEAVELIPYRHVFTSPHLQAPIEGLICHRGNLIAILGPLPPTGFPTGSVDACPWILLLRNGAQVVLGLPIFEEAAENNVIPLMPENPATLEELLQSAG